MQEMNLSVNINNCMINIKILYNQYQVLSKLYSWIRTND